MTDRAFVKKEFKSKNAVTKCGYCNLKIKDENLENHCKTIHHKAKLAAGQVTLDSMFKRKVVDRGAEAQKRAAEAKSISRKILSKSFVLQLSGTSDM